MNKQWIKENEFVLSVIVFPIFLCTVAFSILYYKTKDIPNYIQQPTNFVRSKGSKSEAISLAKNELVKTLRTPSTVKFVRAEASDFGEEIFQVTITYDAQNAFGAMVRETWTGKVDLK